MLAKNKELYCLLPLNNAINKSLEDMKEKANVMLNNCCKNFNPSNYHKVLLTQFRLGNSFNVVTLLKDFYTSLINTTVQNFVYVHCCQQRNISSNPNQLSKLKE